MDIGGPFKHCMGQGRILDLYWALEVESVWTWFGLGRLSGPWTGLMDFRHVYRALIWLIEPGRSATRRPDRHVERPIKPVHGPLSLPSQN